MDGLCNHIFYNSRREALRHLLAIKQCHCCSNRSTCDRKDSEENLSGTARKFMKVKEGWRMPMEVLSFCTEFDLETTRTV